MPRLTVSLTVEERVNLKYLLQHFLKSSMAI
ncbi:hypothetical protein DSTSK_36890 [Desulforhabdus sp. TSK]|nr:hypothetical protein DSTSK_36890 [Desulforhabdus sp. TSK]